MSLDASAFVSDSLLSSISLANFSTGSSLTNSAALLDLQIYYIIVMLKGILSRFDLPFQIFSSDTSHYSPFLVGPVGLQTILDI